MVDEAVREAYRAAWEGWTRQLERVHAALLDGEAMTPDRLKGLLNREARAKRAYDAARLRLLGIDEGAEAAPSDGGNPFR